MPVQVALSAAARWGICAPGATGELTVDASVAGDWVLIVEGGDSETETAFPVS